MIAAWEHLSPSSPTPPDASPPPPDRTVRQWEIGWLDRFASTPDRYRRLPSPPPSPS
jgi:hypothetical protein